MAAVTFGSEYTVTATAVKITTALALSEQKFFTDLVIKADINNANPVYFGQSNVTTSANRQGVLYPGESITYSLGQSRLSTDSIFLIGTTGSDKVFITGVI